MSEKQKILLGRCVNCEEIIFESDFKKDEELKWFAESGLCLQCQKGMKNDKNKDA